ncbi:mitochondrial ATP synthase g subunit-domain-containing protein [Daldinia decipiens]|uniref:mitochondrial ATP synthase g subunit-domain-containing protein n=1 Tax=Daldinia decipiens TaxID=326647 RepID=UPI0020C29978|nr:mitochondrial ATP synthase g subunit-domain-containing protein [Daldinia decipiens]KAI1656861.1 mitochondrial ATP synthase g subunit-domain-containing protein [Daldinia decipiens]
MSSALARPLLRQTGAWGRMAARRFESTTTAKASEAAKETAKETASKASSKASQTAAQYAAKASEYTAKATEYSAKAAQGLSRVTSTAGPAIAGAAKGIANSLGKVGGRTGRLVAFFERSVPTVVYYSKVGSELAKIVFRGQKMSPPSLTTVQSYWQNVLQSVKNPNSLLQTASKIADQPATIIQQARNISRAQLVTTGVLVAECIGFFTVGEMIGRFKIIGYHGGSHAEHH